MNGMSIFTHKAPTKKIAASGTQYLRQVVITWSMRSRAASSESTS